MYKENLNSKNNITLIHKNHQNSIYMLRKRQSIDLKNL